MLSHSSTLIAFLFYVFAAFTKPQHFSPHLTSPPPLRLAASSPTPAKSNGSSVGHCAKSEPLSDEGVSFMSERDISLPLCTASQDTGYQTETLPGSTDPFTFETASNKHTNLTAQFSTLPLSNSTDDNIDMCTESYPALKMAKCNENSAFETAIPISTTQRHAAPPMFERQTSLPEPLIQSLPQSLPQPASIPISISRQPSVSYNLSDSLESQRTNEGSPQPTSPLDQISDEEIIRRARKVLGKAGIESPQQTQVPVQGFPWYMYGATTPQKQKLSGLAKTLERRQHNVEHMLPSK